MDDVLYMIGGVAIFFIVELVVAVKQERDHKRKH